MATRSFDSIAVYCGASTGNRSEYISAARELGEIFVKRKIKLVYGGKGMYRLRYDIAMVCQ